MNTIGDLPRFGNEFFPVVMDAIFGLKFRIEAARAQTSSAVSACLFHYMHIGALLCSEHTCRQPRNTSSNDDNIAVNGFVNIRIVNGFGRDFQRFSSWGNVVF